MTDEQQDVQDQPAEEEEALVEPEPERGPIVGTLALKLTLRESGAGEPTLPTLEALKTSIEGWDLSHYGIEAVVTHAEWT